MNNIFQAIKNFNSKRSRPLTLFHQPHDNTYWTTKIYSYPDAWSSLYDTGNIPQDESLVVLQRIHKNKFGSWVYDNEWLSTYEGSPNFPQKVNYE